MRHVDRQTDDPEFSVGLRRRPSSGLCQGVLVAHYGRLGAQPRNKCAYSTCCTRPKLATGWSRRMIPGGFRHGKRRMQAATTMRVCRERASKPAGKRWLSVARWEEGKTTVRFRSPASAAAAKQGGGGDEQLHLQQPAMEHGSLRGSHRQWMYTGVLEAIHAQISPVS